MKKENLLPAAALAGGLIGFALRRWELRGAFEPDTGLHIAGAPATLALALFSLALCAVLCARSAGLGTRGGWDGAFRMPGVAEMTACIAAAFLLLGAGALEFVSGAAQTPLYTYSAEAPSALRLALGRIAVRLPGALTALGALCLLFLSHSAYRDERAGNGSLALLLPPAAAAVRLIFVYRDAAEDPVAANYIYRLFAAIAVMLALYFMASFGFEKVKPGRFCAAALCAAYLSVVSLADATDWTALLGGAGWAVFFTVTARAVLKNAAPRRPRRLRAAP